MHRALSWKLLVVCLLAATSARAGERCEAARSTFAKVAAGHACSRDIWWAGWVDCANDMAEMRKFWDLTEACLQKVAQSPERGGRLSAIRKERAELSKELEPLLADRPSIGLLALGIVPAGAGAISIVGTMLYALSGWSLYGPVQVNRLQPNVALGLLIGGAVGVCVGVAVMLAVLAVRHPHKARISPLQDRINDLDSAENQELTDEARLRKLEGASSLLPPPPPLHVAFTVARF